MAAATRAAFLSRCMSVFLKRNEGGLRSGESRGAFMNRYYLGNSEREVGWKAIRGIGGSGFLSAERYRSAGW